jgi:hypothetical protein
MLSSQFPHLPSTDNKATRWLPQIFIAIYLLMSLVWAFSTEATWDDDCPGRAYNALHAFSEPIQFISPWNRPLFILVFSIPVQFGFWTIPVLMSGITALSAWALYRGVAKLGVPNAAFVLPLFLFQTFPFVISHNALTEPMAMALIAAGFWALVEKKWWLFGLFGGLVVLARLELVLLLPIWAYLLVRKRQYLPILLLGFPFLLWNLAGGLITGDWAYVFSATLGAAGEESRYGQTPWGHYFMRYIYVIGPVVLFLFLLGMLDRLRRRQFAAFLDLQFLVGFLAYVWIGAMVAAGNSAGFLRNLIPMTPLVALLALEGMNVYISTAESKAGDGKGTKYASWLVMGLGIALTMACATVFNKALKMHMLFDPERSFWANTVWMGALAGLWLVWNAVKGKEGNHAPKRVMAGALAISGLAISFTLLAEPPGANDSRERQIMGEVGDLIQPELAQGAPLYVNHIWYFWTQGEDPKAKTTFPVTVRELDAAPEGAIVLWDLHYSPRLAGNVRHDYFDAHREWTELLRYRTVDGNFMAMVFRKGKAIHKQAVEMSNAYLAQHQQLAAAWSASGNVHMRWGDFPQGRIQPLQSHPARPQRSRCMVQPGFGAAFHAQIATSRTFVDQSEQGRSTFPFRLVPSWHRPFRLGATGASHFRPQPLHRPQA